MQESDLNSEIAKLERGLRNYQKQERRLITLLRYGEVTQDYVLDEVNTLKREYQNDQEELEKLKQTKARLSYLDDAQINLNEFCRRVRQNLDNATVHDKRLALDALDIRITASTHRIDIKGSIPVEITSLPRSTDVTTIAQTSASQHGCSYPHPPDG